MDFHPGWDKYYSKLDKTMQLRVWKKIQQLKHLTGSRHLKQGFPYFVSDIGQYRLCYKINEAKKLKTIYFVGDHKQYEKWLGMIG